jgi:hypothetical protein
MARAISLIGEKSALLLKEPESAVCLFIKVVLRFFREIERRRGDAKQAVEGSRIALRKLYADYRTRVDVKDFAHW